MRVEVWQYPRLGRVIRFVTVAGRSGSFVLSGLRAGHVVVKSLETPDDGLVVDLTAGARVEVEVRSSATK